MQQFLPSRKHGLRLLPFWVRYAAIHRANGGALWLFVKADTFGAFIRYDVVKVIADGRLLYVRRNDIASLDLVRLGDGGAFAHLPLYAAFIDGSIGAFWFAGSAVDTVVGDKNSHGEVYWYFGLLGIKSGTSIFGGSYVLSTQLAYNNVSAIGS